MIVITMTDCPPKLRGDLSKWLCEINTGVYVGHVSARVRSALWDRVCQNLKTGRATMVFSTNGEQKMRFYVHNTTWKPVDFDGITLMQRPLPQALETDTALKPGFSKAAKWRMAQRNKSEQAKMKDTYVVIDLETTGLQTAADEIIEFAAIRVENGAKKEEFSCLVRCEKPVPQKITEITGITDSMLLEQGVALQKGLSAFLKFIENEKLVGYNISFDMNFLRAACKRCNFPMPSNRCVDLLNLSRRKVSGITNYKLTTLANHFSLPVQTAHRALEDCKLMDAVYRKLNE